MLFTDEKMFPNDRDASKHSLVFMAGFHIGIPFYMYPGRDPNRWKEVKNSITLQISKNSTHFQIVQMDYHPETFFPLGKPLIIKYAELFHVFDLPTYIQEKGISLPHGNCQLDQLIWICPNGVVLVMAQVSCERDGLIKMAQLQEIVEEHYAELTFIFNEIAAVIFASIPTKALSSLLHSGDDIEKCKQAITYNRKLVPSESGNWLESFRWASQSIRANSEILSLYEEILLDVYFIDFNESSNTEKISIRYTDSLIKFSDRSHLPLLGIGFSTFVGFLWIQKHLRRVLGDLKSTIGTKSRYAEQSFSQLKLLRMFVVSSINESYPINVRLKAQYMKRLQEFWEAEEISTLLDQIKSQLETLDEMFKWIENSQSATRTFRFAVGGVLFALLSSCSTVNTLISTIDVNKQISLEHRIAVIVIVLCIIGLLYWGIWKLQLPGKK